MGGPLLPTEQHWFRKGTIFVGANHPISVGREAVMNYFMSIATAQTVINASYSVNVNPIPCMSYHLIYVDIFSYSSVRLANYKLFENDH